MKVTPETYQAAKAGKRVRVGRNELTASRLDELAFDCERWLNTIYIPLMEQNGIRITDTNVRKYAANPESLHDYAAEQALKALDPESRKIPYVCDQVRAKAVNEWQHTFGDLPTLPRYFATGFSLLAYNKEDKVYYINPAAIDERAAVYVDGEAAKRYAAHLELCDQITAFARMYGKPCDREFLSRYFATDGKECEPCRFATY